MKTVFEHIEHVKGKPHHIRKRVAFTAAATVTGVIAFVWLVGSFSLGAFALKNNSFADSTGQSPVLTTDNNDVNSNLTGTAAVTAAVVQGASAPARIEIVDTTSTVSGQKKAEQTTIPF